jgi:energy-converting hydrogenase A subunit R
MQLAPEGGRVFEVISRYDDLLTLEERPDYEPGDTLSLIVPFLVLHDTSEADIARLAGESKLTGGAERLVSQLEYRGWKIFCISTSYEQFALHITQRLGIFRHNVACTRFPLDELRLSLSGDERRLLQEAEQEILNLHPPDDDSKLKGYLDDFFWKRLPATAIGEAMQQVKPVGGQRKVTALNGFADKYDEPLSKWVTIGDSITDFHMLRAVDEAGGLAIAFNANEYAIPYATMSLASTDISDLLEVLDEWKKGQRKKVEPLVKQKEKSGGTGDRGHFHWLAGRKDLDDIITTHKRIRKVVREAAGNLG